MGRAAKHRSRAPFALGLDPAAYNPQGLRAYETDELKREYSRLRREAEDRLRKLGRSEFADSQAYRQNAGKFQRLKEIGDDRRKLERLLIDAERFVMSKRSSASGQREIRREAIQSLRANGYTWVNTRNFNDFVEYMDELRARGAQEEFYRAWAVAEDDGEEDPDELRERRAMRNDQRRAFEAWREERDAQTSGPKKQSRTGKAGRR